MATQARQVAHDIRSPVAALEVASADTAELPEETRLLIHSAIDRIHDIANSLLNQQLSPPPTPGASVAHHLLTALINPLIGEKHLQFRSHPQVKIELCLDKSSNGLLAAVEPIEFKRLLSNLINNAVEAVDEHGGTVKVCLASRNGRALTSVQDDGKGIPPEILVKLGRRGETHGKRGGTGLGLYHARTTAESWGGSLTIVSEVGKGTTATVDLPQASASGATTDPRDVVLIDDDPLVRKTWKMAAARAGRRFSEFATFAEFMEAAPPLDRLTTVYVDADLGDGVNGAQESVRIRELGFERIYLATGHPAASFAGFTHLSGVVGKEPPWSDAPTV
ncbi:MAG: hypothetical protein COV48_16350 [Elusimicrobia bacterium CG11_big_fil_rev_8_21_14_0_20_64_6]|nr:MAG: hypothetical protein COV48_16350 [Elusimicrobia bacterium CG11_big_fil_rev_8_21_14_0_20_64_6]